MDTLFESKKYGAKAKKPRFTKREEAIKFLDDLFQRGYFWRAKKLVLKKKEEKEKEKTDSKASPKATKKKPKVAESRDSEAAGDSAAEGKKDQKSEKSEKVISFYDLFEILGRGRQKEEENQAHCT